MYIFFLKKNQYSRKIENFSKKDEFRLLTQKLQDTNVFKMQFYIIIFKFQVDRWKLSDSGDTATYILVIKNEIRYRQKWVAGYGSKNIL